MYSICSFIFDFSWIVCGLKDLPRLLLRCYIGCLRQTLTGTFSSFWQVRSELWCVACAAMNCSKRFISFLVKANIILRRCCFWMVVFRAFSYLRPLFFFGRNEHTPSTFHAKSEDLVATRDRFLWKNVDTSQTSKRINGVCYFCCCCVCLCFDRHGWSYEMHKCVLVIFCPRRHANFGSF